MAIRSLLSRTRGRLGRLKRRVLNQPVDAVAVAAANFWDQQSVKQSMYWAEYPLVRQYVNHCVTGVEWLWPLSAFKVGWAYEAFERGLSIGCGTGALERAVMHLNICHSIEGLDVSKSSIRQARNEARRERMRAIRYRVRDCDALTLAPSRYDVVFFHGSLHHVSDPDRLLDEVVRALKPHGMLYVDEYVGPSRDEWSDEHLAHARSAFESIPEELKLWPVNPPLDWSDPSEMIRSSRIRPAVESRFEIVHYKPYWGNLLFPLLSALDGHLMTEPARAGLVESLIQREKELVESGEFVDPLFAVIVARKRSGSNP
ncbi:MAG: class I SAM-dependent methyltransferase [Thermoanaerobaculia bacterium]